MYLRKFMPISAAARRSKLSIVFTSTVRVLFTTLLFTAAGMGAGLFLGILGTVVYGMMSGSKVDMANAYKHVAIPIAITRWLGCANRIGDTGSARPPNTNIPVTTIGPPLSTSAR